MPGFGSIAYGGAPYGGSLARTYSATDSFTWGDAATVGFHLRANDSWSVADAATGVPLRDANDSWTISDAASRALSLPRATTDSWTISDAAYRTFIVSAADSWSASDVASAARNLPRGATDSWTWSDQALHTQFAHAADSWTWGDAAQSYHAPRFIDLPVFLALNPSLHKLTLRAGESLALSPASNTLQLKSAGNASSMNSTKRGLALKDDPVHEVIDG